jgi:hypothetical protein
MAARWPSSYRRRLSINAVQTHREREWAPVQTFCGSATLRAGGRKKVTHHDHRFDSCAGGGRAGPRPEYRDGVLYRLSTASRG